MTLRATVQALGALDVCATLVIICTLYATDSTAQNTKQSQPKATSDASPIYGIKIPAGYHDWRLIAVNQLVGAEAKLKRLRAQLGNDVALRAFQRMKLPFPDGTIIAALHWKEVSSDENDKVLATGLGRRR
jgi:hypothetical protein